MSPRALLLLCLLLPTVCRAQTHPFQAAQPDNAPQEARLTVEIPAGSNVKYEIGKDGLLHVDRFIAMPVTYPANYGSMPRTLAGDGDPLDALVLTRTPLHPGSVILFRPVAVLRMRDGGDADDKIIGVPVDKVDATYQDVRDLADLPRQEVERIEAFFRVYKQVPAGGKPIVLGGWGDAAQARAIIAAALKAGATGR